MKKIISILCIGALLFSITACSSNNVEESNKLSSEAEEIMASLQPDERIDDFLDAYDAFEIISNENIKDYKTALETLVKISEKYEINTDYESFLDGKDISILIEVISLQKYEFFKELVIPVYVEKKEFEAILPINLDEFEEVCNREGYYFEVDNSSFDRYSKKYYKSESQESDRVSVKYDYLGRIDSFFLTMKISQSWTNQQFEEFYNKTEDEKDNAVVAAVKKDINSLNIEDNVFFNLIYSDEEIDKIQSFLTNVSEDWLMKNNEIQAENSTAITNIVEIGNTDLLIIGDATSGVSASISASHLYYDKYHAELDILERGYTDYSGSYGQNDEEPTYKTIDEVLNELSISEADVSNVVETEKTEEPISNIDIFKNLISDTWLTVSSEGDGSKKTFYYVFGADQTGTHYLNDDGVDYQLGGPFSYTISYVSEDGTQGKITCQYDTSDKVLAIDASQVEQGILIINDEVYWREGRSEA